VKTDGKYVYTYQEGEHAIIVLDAKNLNKVKTLQIPVNYSGISFYVTKNTLVLTATRYTTIQNSGVNWYNNTQKSIVTIYDIRDITRASVIRSIEVDGSLSDTRLGDTGMLTAVVTTSYWMPPLYRPYFIDGTMTKQARMDYTARNLIPQISDQQFRNNRKTVTNKAIADCTSMSSVLPKISGANPSPTLTSILRFDTSVPDSRIATQIVVSDAGQIHVTPDSIYLTTSIWTQDIASKCPANARCMNPMIWNPGTANTLIHRFSVDNANIRYNYSRQIPGTPLNQYSMDEDGDHNFRIVTTLSSWSGGTNTSTTGLSVLSPTGTVIGSLSGLAPGENFQSSRFIGDRLYLVTFQQIDPLFVISLTDSKNPKVLGELKIPGYSTYLHPYDANRLIGIGYDTFTNSHGGTQNGGLKIDLYNVSDIKNPKQERSLVLGDMGSSADALSNPKAFVWYKEKNLLLLPATLMTTAGDRENPYLSKAAFQGVVGVSITPDQIVEKFRLSHIVKTDTMNTEWKNNCKTYTY
jgi:Beta propeller domain